jgi:hypothetical protein
MVAEASNSGLGTRPAARQQDKLPCACVGPWQDCATILPSLGVFGTHYVEDLGHALALAPIGAEPVHLSGHAAAGAVGRRLNAKPIAEQGVEFSSRI